jgi:hypothetical protein
MKIFEKKVIATNGGRGGPSIWIPKHKHHNIVITSKTPKNSVFYGLSKTPKKQRFLAIFDHLSKTAF